MKYFAPVVLGPMRDPRMSGQWLSSIQMK